MEESNNGYIVFHDWVNYQNYIVELGDKFWKQKIEEMDQELQRFLGVEYMFDDNEKMFEYYQDYLETEEKLKYQKDFCEFINEINKDLWTTIRKNKPNIIFNDKEYTYDEYEEWIFVKLDM